MSNSLLIMMQDELVLPSMSSRMPSAMTWQSAADPSQLQCVDYEKTQQQMDPASAPEKQAKIAMDAAIVSGDINQLQMVMTQIGQHLPQHRVTLMMHALRTAARQGNLNITQALLEQISSCQPQEVFEIMRYALDGATAQQNPGMLEFLLGTLQKGFSSTHPQQFLQLVQHATNAAGKQGNLGLLKFLMDHTAAASIPINYHEVFSQAACKGQAETLMKEAIIAGAVYENVILMLLQGISSMPRSNDSGVGSRQSLKDSAKIQLVRSYKRSNPELFTKLMSAFKSYFPEECGSNQGGVDGDMEL